MKERSAPRHQREKHFKNHFWLSFGAQKRTLLRFLQKLRQLLLHLRQRISAVADGVLLVGSQLGIAAALRVGALVRLAHTALVGDEERVVAEAVVPGQPLKGDAARAFAPAGEMLAGGRMKQTAATNFAPRCPAGTSFIFSRSLSLLASSSPWWPQ